MFTIHFILGVSLSLLLLFASSALTHTIRNGDNVKYQVDVYPRTDNPHDLIVGNCTNLEGINPAYLNGSRDAIPGQVVDRIDRYWWPNTIYCIRMFDRLEDGTGGYPFIESGGVGHQDVSLGYTSQPSKPLKYYLEMYVHSDNIQ